MEVIEKTKYASTRIIRMNIAPSEMQGSRVRMGCSPDSDKQWRLPLYLLPDFLKIGSFLLVLSIAGCATIGPESVTRDRFDYNTAISDSWKEQTLLNIVKIRYADMPLFVEVASIVSGYTLERSVSVNGMLSSSNAVQRDSLSLGGNGKFTDRPTITYVPITGTQFNKSFMTPIPPDVVLFLMQTGWQADLILPLTVDSINGLRSHVVAGANQRAGDASYYRVIELVRQIQQSGAISMRIKKAENMRDTTVLLFQKEGLEPDVQAARQELSGLLGLRPDAHEVSINYGLIPGGDNEIAMLTRSMLHIMILLATKIDVPPEHIADGRTVPAMATTENRKLMKIHHSKERPADAFTAVKYRDYWYWVDDRDFKTKRTFAFLMILFSLTETGGKEGLPLVTIPSG
jgi:hypothetical protein